MILENPAASFSFDAIQDDGTRQALEEVKRLIVTHENQQLAYAVAPALGALTGWLRQMGI